MQSRLGDGGDFQVSTFVDLAKQALEKIQQEAIPLRNRLAKLDKQESFLQGVLDGAKELFPDARAQLKAESIVSQYNSKTVLRQLPPARRMQRRPKAVLSAALLAAFEETGGAIHCRVLAERLVAKGLYSSTQSAILTAEKFMKDHPDQYVKVAPRTYQLRTGAALVGEIIEAKGKPAEGQAQLS